jgi:hypothetical protein
MTKFRILAIPLGILVAYLTLQSQATAPAGRSTTISASLSVQMEKGPTGPGPWAILTMKNISNRNVSFRTDMTDYRIHVEGEKGEPPKTSYHRSIRGEFQPGDKNLVGGGVIDSVPPGGSEVRKYDLTKFYDLTVSDKFVAYIEVRDESSGTWLRTNTVQFTMQAPAQ